MLKDNIGRNVSTRKLTKIGLLSAITIVMGLTGIGFIPLPAFKLTIMHIPVIIGAILEGPVVGAVIGLMFGLFSLYQNLVNPTVVSFVFYNPLVSVLPRVLIGITAYYSYKLTSRFSDKLGAAVGAAVGTLTNTIGVVSMIFILYLQEYAVKKSQSVAQVEKALLGLITTNAVLEALTAVLITVPIVMAVKSLKRN